MFSKIGPAELLIVLVIVALIFGTKKLRTMGSDLGSAVKSFRKAVGEGESEDDKPSDPATEKKVPPSTVPPQRKE